MWRVKLDATPWLNVRWRIGTAKEDVIGKFLPGTKVTVSKFLDGWAQIAVTPTVFVWVNATYLESEDHIPTEEMPNRIGWHILPDAPRERIVAMLRRLHEANKPVPIVLLGFVTDGRAAMSVEDVRIASPRTKVIARVFTGSDYHAEDKGGWDRVTRADGREYFERNAALLTRDIQRADFVQIRDLNEPGEGLKINEWHHGILDGANEMGIRVCIYTFSVGNPGLPDDARPYRDFWKWDSTHELLRRVKREGHAFTLHQYAYRDQWTDDSLIMRHKRIYPLLPDDLQDLPLYLAEFGESYIATGTPADRSPARYANRIRTANRQLLAGPGAPLACLWTLGDTGGWSRDRLEGVMGEYERFAMEAAA